MLGFSFVFILGSGRTVTLFGQVFTEYKKTIGQADLVNIYIALKSKLLVILASLGLAKELVSLAVALPLLISLQIRQR